MAALRVIRDLAPALLGALVLWPVSALAQVVINEYSYDDSGDDDREFVELYNAGATPVPIGDWQLSGTDEVGSNSAYTISPGTVLPAGGFYVLGAATVPNVDQVLGTMGLWENGGNGGETIELFNAAGALVDAVLYEANKGSGFVSPEVRQQVGLGWWGNFISINFTEQSVGRYLDGRDTNQNGRDFGLIPRTPGASNNLPQNPTYRVPDVDQGGLLAGDEVPGFLGSFVNAIVIEPFFPDNFNTFPISPSPQGGNAITAWDPAGGGNMVASTELVTQFDIYAYFDTLAFGVGGAESTTYGIGTTGTFYNLPDPGGAAGDFFGDISTANANTGVGWIYEKEDSSGATRLHLVDFGQGGDSSGDAGASTPRDWKVITTIDLTNMPSDWYRLGIEIDNNTGNVTARFQDQEFSFPLDSAAAAAADFDSDTDVDGADLAIWQDNFGLTTAATRDVGDADLDGDVEGKDFLIWQSQSGSMGGASVELLGTFYIGYRESLDGVPLDLLSPPRFDVVSTTPLGAAAATVPEPAAWIAVCLYAGLVPLWRRR